MFLGVVRSQNTSLNLCFLSVLSNVSPVLPNLTYPNLTNLTFSKINISSYVSFSSFDCTGFLRSIPTLLFVGRGYEEARQAVLQSQLEKRLIYVYQSLSFPNTGYSEASFTASILRGQTIRGKAKEEVLHIQQVHG